MARRTLSPEEEDEIAREAEEASRAGAELVSVKARTAESASAVLSVRIAMKDLVALRALAEKRRISLATLVQDAVASYAATGGAEEFASATRATFYSWTTARSRAYNPPAGRRPKSQLASTTERLVSVQ